MAVRACYVGQNSEWKMVVLNSNLSTYYVYGVVIGCLLVIGLIRSVKNGLKKRGVSVIARDLRNGDLIRYGKGWCKVKSTKAYAMGMVAVEFDAGHWLVVKQNHEFERMIS